jgi:hypothetical protein
MKRILVWLSIVYSFNSFSQINFEQGYFISNNGQKTECLIKNIDWKNNPKNFEYKLSADQDSDFEDIKNVKEFKISDKLKYGRYTIDIDKSKSRIELKQLSDSREPEFVKETLFLKFLVEGEGNLLEYVDGNLRRFFYSKKDETPIQLVYKEFKNNNDEIAENNTFKKQLLDNFKCESIDLNYLKKLKYRIESLTNYFTAFNTCNNSEFTNYSKNQGKQNSFNLNIRPGVSIASFFRKDNPNEALHIDFGAATNLRFGLEFEFIMPFNARKWSIFIEPTYRAYNTSRNVSIDLTSILTVESDVTVDYKAIDFPIGFRHYLFLGSNSKLFLDAAFVFSVANSSSSIDFETEAGNALKDTELKGSNNLAFGLGYKYDKYSFQLRYGLDRQVIEALIKNSEFSSLSFIFGYTIL